MSDKVAHTARNAPRWQVHKACTCKCETEQKKNLKNGNKLTKKQKLITLSCPN